MKPIIKVENLSKQYRLGANQSPQMTFRETLVAAVKSPINKFKKTEEQKEAQSFWALKDVNFEIYPGEVVGIIGRNGAGKSTLLKILSRITEPTTGKIELFGRVGSLLEVGTGFHPELTGRENIFLNGAILGMRREEIARKFDEIVDFAEVEKFIDTPVKHYSSGMYTRLAFAVAANLEPEILIVDEVLAVGDAEFQKKCLGKMKDVSEHGRTVIFVSHNMAAVKSLCQRGLILKAGELILDGNVDQTTSFYLNDTSQMPATTYTWDEDVSLSEVNTAKIVSIKVSNDQNDNTSQIPITSSIFFEVEYVVYKKNANLSLTLIMYSQEGTHVFSSPSITDTQWYQQPHHKGHFLSHCEIPANLLNHGRFDFTLLLVENGSLIVDQLDKLITLSLIDLGENNSKYYGSWGGVVRPSLNWQTYPIKLDIES